MNALLKKTPAEALVGTIRTFGELGPVYEVTGIAGEEHVHVTVIESGETLEYPTEHALADPAAS